MKTTTISASELYESVWQHPLKFLADKWHVHPHALGQLLDKHGIHRPGNGYWAKKSMGKPVVVTPFPKSLSTNILIDISCLQFSKTIGVRTILFPLCFVIRKGPSQRQAIWVWR
jgi:hypothetical protein